MSFFKNIIVTIILITISFSKIYSQRDCGSIILSKTLIEVPIRGGLVIINVHYQTRCSGANNITTLESLPDWITNFNAGGSNISFICTPTTINREREANINFNFGGLAFAGIRVEQKHTNLVPPRPPLTCETIHEVNVSGPEVTILPFTREINFP